MSESVTTTVEAFYLNEDEENTPAKIQAADGNIYSTFQPGQALPDGLVSEGDEIVIEYVTTEQGYRNIESVEIVDSVSEYDVENSEMKVAPAGGAVSGKRASIQAQKALDKAVDTELSLAAQREDYEFSSEGVGQRTEEYLGIIRRNAGQGDQDE